MNDLIDVRCFSAEESKDLYDYFFNDIKSDAQRINFLSGNWTSKIPNYTSHMENFYNILVLVGKIAMEKPEWLEKVVKVKRNFEALVDSLSSETYIGDRNFRNHYIGRSLFNKDSGIPYGKLNPLLADFFTSVNADIILKDKFAKDMDVPSVDPQFWVDSILKANKRISNASSYPFFDIWSVNLNTHISYMNDLDIKWLEKVKVKQFSENSPIKMDKSAVFFHENIAQLVMFNYKKITDPDGFNKLISLLPPEALIAPIECAYGGNNDYAFAKLARMGNLIDASMNYFTGISESNSQNKKDIVLLDYVLSQQSGDFKNKLSPQGIAQFLNFIDYEMLKMVMADGTREDLEVVSINVKRVSTSKVKENKNAWKDHPFVVAWLIDKELNEKVGLVKPGESDFGNQFKL